MTAPKKAYAAICPRCEGKGSHQGGRCFQCRGARIIGLKSSTVMKTYRHGLTVDGKRMNLVTWGRDLKEATQAAIIWMEENGLTINDGAAA